MDEELFKSEVARILERMSVMDPTTDEYMRAGEALKVLCEARSKKAARTIDPEVLLIESIRFVQLIMVLNHERLHIIATRAFGMLRR
jgi:hypothetical protein